MQLPCAAVPRIRRARVPLPPATASELRNASRTGSSWLSMWVSRAPTERGDATSERLRPEPFWVFSWPPAWAANARTTAAPPAVVPTAALGRGDVLEQHLGVEVDREDVGRASQGGERGGGDLADQRLGRRRGRGRSRPDLLGDRDAARRAGCPPSRVAALRAGSAERPLSYERPERRPSSSNGPPEIPFWGTVRTLSKNGLVEEQPAASPARGPWRAPGRRACRGPAR